MKNIIPICGLVLVALTARSQYGISVDTNTHIVHGTNFFGANTNLLWAALPPQFGGGTGSNGTNSTIVITNTLTGVAGSQALVTNLGSPTAAVLQFTIPQGLPGADGTGGSGGGGSSGIDIPLTNVPSCDASGTNYALDFSLPAQTWSGSNFALRFSTNWPSTVNTSRQSTVFIPATNITRAVALYGAATNWQTAGFTQPMLLAGNQSAVLRANIFGVGETNVSVSFIASKSIASPGENFFNPLGIPGCVLWLNAGQGLYNDVAGTSNITVNGSIVRRWADQSGNGNDVTNGLSTDYWSQFGMPKNLPAVHFLRSYSGSFLSSISSNVVSSPVWLFIVTTVFSRDEMTMIDSINGNGTEYAATLMWCDNCNAICASSPDGGDYLYRQMSIATNENIISVNFNSVNSVIRTNGAAAVTGDVGTVPRIGFVIGDKSNHSQPFSGQIAEILVYSANLSSENVTNIEQYLNAKYAIY
jgi:hypothetical protein